MRSRWDTLVMAILAVLLTAGATVAFGGCKAMQYGKAGVVPEILHAQAPGTAEGAGGSITGPTNSAAPTTQIAERRATYFPPFVAPPSRVQVNTSPDSPLTPAPKETGLPVILAPAPIPPVVASTYERTETSFGQHQSATGIVKAAAALESWSTFKWLSLGALVVGLGGMLYSYNNHESGYMLVWMKVAGIGAACLLFADNPFWLLLLLIPVGFYAFQKFNLLRLP
jgi:hypothetical protein